MIYEADGPLKCVVKSQSKHYGPRVTLICDCGCGALFERPRADVNLNTRHYLSNEHRGAHRTETYLQEMCGSFLAIVKEFFAYCSTRNFKDIHGMRSRLGPFFLYLNEQGIDNLEVVGPKRITQFLQWAEDVDCDNAAYAITNLVQFFKWAIRSGYRKATCPVVPSFHKKKRPSLLPRPYSLDEMERIWGFALERGNSRIRAIIAIGEQAGLRIGEICRLREEDVYMESRRLFVRIPNKTDTERWAYFGDKTAQYLSEWQSDRDSNCGHDALFHNSLGDPLQPSAAHNEMCKTFCKTVGGCFLHIEGLDNWSTHRLRHTMATKLASGGADLATIMAAGGWKSPSTAMNYAQIDMVKARRNYDDAMRRYEENSTAQSTVEILDWDQFLAAYAKEK